MAIYVYRRQPSEGANELAEALEATRFRARTLPIERKVRSGDHVIAWGEHVPTLPTGVNVLNGGPIRSKYQDAIALREAGVPTIVVTRNRPVTGERRVAPAPVDPVLAAWENARALAEAFGDLQNQTAENIRGPVGQQSITNLIAQLNTVVASSRTPAPRGQVLPNVEWLPRMNDHVGGNDLLTPPRNPDFWVQKENLVAEYRIHSFHGRSIRAGKKDLRDGYGLAASGRATERLASSWIRSWDGGWRILYDGVSARQRHRDIAHAAVKALGLDFGAVDIGEKADGSLIVLEVNRAPGLAEGTVDRYASAIQQWIDGRRPEA